MVVVIPARNERERLPAVLERLPRAHPDVSRIEPLVVDDGSTDDTAERAKALGVKVIRHPISLGKGGALQTGCEAALRLGAEVIVCMDADGQHNPADVPRMLTSILIGTTDVVLGKRDLEGEMPPVLRLGNSVLNLCVRLLFGVDVSDTQCGFRAFRADCYPRLRWQARDYAVESEMLVRMARARLRWREVPISTVYHDRYKGTQPVDGLRILRQLLLWRLRA